MVHTRRQLLEGLVARQGVEAWGALLHGREWRHGVEAWGALLHGREWRHGLTEPIPRFTDNGRIHPGVTGSTKDSHPHTHTRTHAHTHTHTRTRTASSHFYGQGSRRGRCWQPLSGTCSLLRHQRTCMSRGLTFSPQISPAHLCYMHKLHYAACTSSSKQRSTGNAAGGES